MESVLAFPKRDAVPVRLENVYAAAEYVYRVQPEAVALWLPPCDADAIQALTLLCGLPLERPPRLFVVAAQRPRFLLPGRVEECLLAPVSEAVIAARIASSWRADPLPSGNTADRQCSELLLRLGVSPYLQGFDLLRIAALQLCAAPCPTSVQIMQDLYPRVAEEAGVSVSVAEHAMRAAIETAWLRADLKTLDAFFGYTTKVSKPTPSNSAFLYALADRIRLRLSDRTDAIAREIRRIER
ncbi:MAG: sporulation initiation factor Spo0A C-terminal domain-containing protein [Clostridia bacterium]|nr:sporulation initiation factor Spo0A C-terminal domain-containing protein [Clostridia bacterium]